MAKLRAGLPSNAFKINGTFIEDDVPGYHTLNAEKKWTLEKQLLTAETNVRDGSVFTGSRYPSREIEIEYFIEGSGWDDLQQKYLKLMQVLNVEDAEIIFNGDSDKFIRGYFVMGNDVETTTITRSGTFTIVCMDPYKYSVTEYTANAVGNEISVNYDGTFPAYPNFEVTFPNTENGSGDSTSTNECGYVGLVDAKEHVLQFGDPDETDWADVQHPATIPVNRTFSSTSGWTVNGSEVITGTQLGSITANSTNKYVYPSGYGTDSSGYHGPSLSLIVTGETPPIATNFNFSWKQKFSPSSNKQLGGFECLLWNYDSGTRKLVGGVRILKTSTSDKKCKVALYVGSTTTAAKTYTVACSKISSGSMKKIDGNITFTVGGKTNTLGSSLIESLVANEITFHFMRNKSKTAVSTNYLYNCKLQRTEFDNFEDVPNTFMPGDVLTIKTASAEVFLDDGSATIPATYLGALGNDWETFTLTPGTNTIGLDYSSFTTTAPTCVMKYRKRYL